MSATPKFLVVIGASAGGLDALGELVRSLQKGLDVAYCIVLHLSRAGVGDFVVQRLGRITDMPCSLAANGEKIRKDHIYIARPNQHLIVKEDHFVLGGGPEENRFRPSIDVLFRSAAVAYNSYVIGVILSGMLDDGTSGMWAIKRCGGSCIVQDPSQAEYPDMPRSVINNMEVDQVAPLEQMGDLIAAISQGKNRRKKAVPKDILIESAISERTAVVINDVEKLGDTTVFACPDCGGNLWSVKTDVIKRYRCHIGHAYTERDLVVKQAETASTTLWVALRMMEERKHMLRKMQVDYEKKGHTTLSKTQLSKQDSLQHHIEQLKTILFDLQNQDTN